MNKVGKVQIITKWDNYYYKVGRVVLLQSGTILLQTRMRITKYVIYYKVVRNTYASFKTEGKVDGFTDLLTKLHMTGETKLVSVVNT